MTINKERKFIKLDASGKKLGRVASEAVKLLRGKDTVEFVPYRDFGATVEITNVEKIEFSRDKGKAKNYWRHSGHLGGIKFTSAEYLWESDPGDVLRKAIYGMLPKNRLRAGMMSRLKIFTGEKK